MQMMDVTRNNAVIAMLPVMHSRDKRVPIEGPTTENGTAPAPVDLRIHTGNYVVLSKSMEAEGTREIVNQLGKNGRDAILQLLPLSHTRTVE